MKFIFCILNIVILALILLPKESHQWGFGSNNNNNNNAQDLYSILQVQRRATEPEIKRAFRKLSKEWHPDVSKNENAKEMYAKMLRAYEVLGDSEKRKLYDVHGVIEGENGVPSASERKQNQRENPFQFSNPFADHHEGGGGGSYHGGGFSGRRKQRDHRIKLSVPELSFDTFSKLRLFRGPRLFMVFVYADINQESRIFAPAFEQISSGQFAENFKQVISFFRVNLNSQDGQAVMNLAGIDPNEDFSVSVPFLFMVRDGEVTVMDSDSVQIMPGNSPGMAEVLSMYVADHTNDLMNKASTSVLATISTKEEAISILEKHSFETLLFLDSSASSQINTVPCAAAVRAQFADISIVLVSDPQAVFDDCSQRKIKLKYERAWLFSVRSSIPAGGNNNNNNAKKHLCDPELGLQHFGSRGENFQDSLVKSLISHFRVKHLGSDSVDGLLRPRLSPITLFSSSSSKMRMITATTLPILFSTAIPERYSNMLNNNNKQYPKDKDEEKEYLHEVAAEIHRSQSDPYFGSEFVSVIQFVSSSVEKEKEKVDEIFVTTVHSSLQRPILKQHEEEGEMTNNIKQQLLTALIDISPTNNNNAKIKNEYQRLLLLSGKKSSQKEMSFIVGSTDFTCFVSVDSNKNKKQKLFDAKQKLFVSLLEDLLSKKKNSKQSSSSSSSCVISEGVKSKFTKQNFDVQVMSVFATSGQQQQDNNNDNSKTFHYLSQFFDIELYPPEPWYATPMRWVFWIFRRAPVTFIAMLVVNWIYRRFIRGNNNNENAADGNNNNNQQPQTRNVPSMNSNNNANSNVFNSGVYGFSTLNEKRDLEDQTNVHFIIAVSTPPSFSSPKQQKQQQQPNPTRPPNSLTSKLTSIKAFPQVQFRGLKYDRVDETNQRFYDIISKHPLFQHAVSTYSSSFSNNNNNNNNNNSSNDGVIFVAVRGGGKKCKAEVCDPDRDLVTFVERIVDGEKMRIDIF